MILRSSSRRPGRYLPTVLSARGDEAVNKEKQCSLWCSCVCHSRNTFPWALPFSTFSDSVSGLPLLLRSCIHGCKGPSGLSGSIVYHLRCRLLALTMEFLPVCGPGIIIGFPRIVLPSNLYLFAHHGDIQGVRGLFSKGVASPWDVNVRGSSALYVSLTNSAPASF